MRRLFGTSLTRLWQICGVKALTFLAGVIFMAMLSGCICTRPPIRSITGIWEGIAVPTLLSEDGRRTVRAAVIRDVPEPPFYQSENEPGTKFAIVLIGADGRPLDPNGVPSVPIRVQGRLTVSRFFLLNDDTMFYEVAVSQVAPLPATRP